jgi:hypothetical protein
MKPRHAAALALVGWYLIAPPIRNGGPDYNYLDEHAAYPDWKLICVLNTEASCERLREYAYRTVSDLKEEDFDADPELGQYSEAECMASDDPRIKGIDLHPLLKPPQTRDKKSP